MLYDVSSSPPVLPPSSPLCLGEIFNPPATLAAYRVMGLPVRLGVELPDMESRFECLFPKTPDEEGVLALAAFAISSEIMPLLLSAFAPEHLAAPAYAGLTARPRPNGIGPSLRWAQPLGIGPSPRSPQPTGIVLTKSRDPAVSHPSAAPGTRGARSPRSSRGPDPAARPRAC